MYLSRICLPIWDLSAHSRQYMVHYMEGSVVQCVLKNRCNWTLDLPEWWWSSLKILTLRCVRSRYGNSGRGRIFLGTTVLLFIVSFHGSRKKGIITGTATCLWTFPTFRSGLYSRDPQVRIGMVASMVSAFYGTIMSDLVLSDSRYFPG